MSDATYPIWTSAQLDFRALVTYLSQHASYPCSLFLRNHLLAPYTARVAHSALRNDAAVDEDPWRTWHDYRRGATVAAIGAVPKCVLNKHIDKDTDVEDGSTEEPLWALVTVAPSYAPGWVEPLADEAEQNSMRFNMWLSSERTLSSGSVGVQRASDEEVSLLRFICKQHLPICVARLAVAVPSSLQHVSTEDERAMVTIFAIHHSWVEAMQKRLYDDDGDDGPNAAQKDVQCVRDNPCTAFVMAEEKARAMVADVLQRAKSTQWHVTPIDKSEATEKVILESNGIAFPTWYLRNRRHLSALLRDGRPLNEDGVSYPSQRQVGAAAGWAYAHDECAVASLHVTEPYRRLTRTSDDSNTVSVGQLCVAHMTDQLIAAQKRALARVGLESLSTPLFSSAESHKAAAVGFHEKTGFTPSMPSTWGALAVRLPHSS